VDGKSYVDNLFYDIGKYQVLTADTALRVIALSWANRVIKDISGRHRHWTWLEKTSTFATVASQMTYDLPTDVDTSGRKILSLKQYTTPTKLTYVNQRRLDELEPDPTTNEADPYLYTYWATAIRLYPVPSQAITMYLRYIKTISALTDSALSTTDIPAKWDDVVIDGMKKFAFSMFPEWGDTGKQFAIFENGIDKMIRDNNEELDAEATSETHGDGGMGRAYTYNKEII